jgi:DNA-binding NarL/FixJ family response regulator
MSARSQTSRRRRVIIVDDHAVVRDGLRETISAQKDLEVCGEAESAPGALEAIGRLNPDLAIVDLSLHGGSGMDLIKNLKTQYPKVVILVLSMHDEGLYAERALRAGASGYVMKRERFARVLEAIRCVLDGHVCLSQAARDRILQNNVGGKFEPCSDVAQLSDRELEVFQLLGEGLSTSQIAKKLHLSLSTVETHRTHIKEKLNLTNGAELMRRAVEWVGSQ